MKIALLGAAGFVGRAAAVELARRPEVGELILVDYVIRDAKKMAKGLSPKCRYAMADVGKAAELTRLLEGIDAVANAVGPCWEYEKAMLLACASMKIARRVDRGQHDVPGGPPRDPRRLPQGGGRRGLRVRDDARVDRPARRPLPGHGGPRAARLRAGAFPVPVLLPRPVRRLHLPARLRQADRRRKRAAPAGAPAGRYFAMADGTVVGVPERKAGERVSAIANTVGKAGDRREGILRGDDAVDARDDGGPAGDARRGLRRLRREETARSWTIPSGKLAGVLLAETAVRLASRSREGERARAAVRADRPGGRQGHRRGRGGGDNVRGTLFPFTRYR